MPSIARSQRRSFGLQEDAESASIVVLMAAVVAISALASSAHLYLIGAARAGATTTAAGAAPRGAFTAGDILLIIR